MGVVLRDCSLRADRPDWPRDHARGGVPAEPGHAIEVADRNTTVAIPSCDDRDEVGAMARAVAIFKENAI
jgi:hypothetical protein